LTCRNAHGAHARRISRQTELGARVRALRAASGDARDVDAFADQTAMARGEQSQGETLAFRSREDVMIARSKYDRRSQRRIDGAWPARVALEVAAGGCDTAGPR